MVLLWCNSCLLNVFMCKVQSHFIWFVVPLMLSLIMQTCRLELLQLKPTSFVLILWSSIQVTVMCTFVLVLLTCKYSCSWYAWSVEPFVNGCCLLVWFADGTKPYDARSFPVPRGGLELGLEKSPGHNGSFLKVTLCCFHVCWQQASFLVCWSYGHVDRMVFDAVQICVELLTGEWKPAHTVDHTKWSNLQPFAVGHSSHHCKEQILLCKLTLYIP